MTILPLVDRPDLATVVAQWHFDEWGHLYPGGTVDGWLDHIRTRCFPSMSPWRNPSAPNMTDQRACLLRGDEQARLLHLCNVDAGDNPRSDRGQKGGRPRSRAALLDV